MGSLKQLGRRLEECLESDVIGEASDGLPIPGDILKGILAAANSSLKGQYDIATKGSVVTKLITFAKATVSVKDDTVKIYALNAVTDEDEEIAELKFHDKVRWDFNNWKIGKEPASSNPEKVKKAIAFAIKDGRRVVADHKKKAESEDAKLHGLDIDTALNVAHLRGDLPGISAAQVPQLADRLKKLMR